MKKNKGKQPPPEPTVPYVKIHVDSKSHPGSCNGSVIQMSDGTSVLGRILGEETPVTNPSDKNWPVSKLVMDVIFNSNDTLQSYFQGRLLPDNRMAPELQKGVHAFQQALSSTRRLQMNDGTTFQQEKDRRKTLLATRLLQFIPDHLICGLFSFNAKQDMERMDKKRLKKEQSKERFKERSKEEERLRLGVLVVELPMNTYIEDCKGTEIVAIHYLKRKKYQLLCGNEDDYFFRNIMKNRQKRINVTVTEYRKKRWNEEKKQIETCFKKEMIPIVLRFATKAYDRKNIYTRLHVGFPFNPHRLSGEAGEYSFDQFVLLMYDHMENILAISKMHGAQSLLLDMGTCMVDALDADSKHFDLHVAKKQ